MKKREHEFMTVGCHDQEYGNYSTYFCEAFGLHIDSFTHENQGFIERWELSTPSFYYEGRTQKEFYATLKQLINIFELGYAQRKAPKNPRSENGKKLKEKAEKDPVCLNSKRKLIIYTDDYDKAFGFFQKMMTEDFYELSFTLMTFIEIRPCWHKMKDIRKIYGGSPAYNVACWARDLYKNYFLKDKNVYLTINQLPRKRIAKYLKLYDPSSLYISYFSYEDYHNAQFGGIVYDYAPSGKTKFYDLRVYDADSFYPYELLTKKFPMTYKGCVYNTSYEYYKDMTFIGLFEIEVKYWPSSLMYLKNIDHRKISECKERLYLTKVDLYNIKDFAEVVNIKTIKLYLFEEDYLPGGVLQEVVDEYMEKSRLKKLKKLGLISEGVYLLQKACLNGIAGDMQMAIRDLEDFKTKSKYRKTPPVWGIFLTAYARYDVLHLASQVEMWIKTDTDCIICKNSKKNIAIIEKYNEQANKLVSDFCKRFNQDFENFRNLGCFELEAIAIEYKCWAKKTYAYIYKDDNGNKKIKFRASGLAVEEDDVTLEWIDKTKLTYPHKKHGDFSKEKASFGEYFSDGYYYEKDEEDYEESDIVIASILMD